MARKKRAPEAVYPIELTDRERSILIRLTQLRRGIKAKIRDLATGKRVVELTKKELRETGDEIESSIRYLPDQEQARLRAALDKVDGLLEGLEEPSKSDPLPKGKPSDWIYQLMVTLEGIRPPIWRRIQVADCTLGGLHDVLQVVMGWDNAHMHGFTVRGNDFGEVFEDDLGFGSDMDDEQTIRLSEISAGAGKRVKVKKVRFKYEYDFGDGWRHQIELERVLAPEASVHYPRCVDGKRACPPEDCGGPWGYAEFVETITDRKHPRHRELKEWFGGKFDPEAFSADEVNEILSSFE